MNSIKTTIKILSRDNFNAEEDKKLDDAVKLLTVAINSDAFKKRVFRFEYNGKQEFNWNEDLTNQQIYELFMSGKDRNGNGADNRLDLRWEVDSSKCPRTTVGVTTTSSRGARTRTYRCKLDDMNAAEFAGHIAHEYCHYLGFSHSKQSSPGRPSTVPYAIGYMLRDLCGSLGQDVSCEELEDILSLQTQLM